MRTSACLLLLFSMLMAGCQPVPAPTSQPVVVAASATPTPQPTQPPLVLEDCITAGGSMLAKCGMLRVPEDRNNPGGRILELAIIVVPARSENHEPDPLFYIPGGPGGVATSSGIVSIAHTLVWKVNAKRDIVFLDQRGTSGSHKLTCEVIPFSVLDSPQQMMNDWMKKCLAGLNGDPRFYTTAEAMRDLDDARAALGYDKINLHGISYGVTAIQVYMRMFPEHVRAAVMDHGTALDVPFAQVEPRVSQAALEQVLAYCEQDEKCRAAYPDIRGDWQSIVDRLRQGPVVTRYMPPGATEPGVVDLNMLADGVHDLLYESGTYAVLPSLIHLLAANEDWTDPVKSISEKYGESGSAEPLLLMKEMIFCFEPAWGFDPDEIARQNPDAYTRDLFVRGAQITKKICASLPKPGPAQIYPPGKPQPLSALMLNSLIDPQNPPSNMDPALKEFTKSRMVVEPTEGHNTSASGCRWDIVSQYIEAGTVDGLSTACMEKQKPAFVIPTE